MEWLEGLGLFGLFIGTFLAATLFPFSSDALYLAILAATADPVGCLLAGTLGNWLGRQSWRIGDEAAKLSLPEGHSVAATLVL